MSTLIWIAASVVFVVLVIFRFSIIKPDEIGVFIIFGKIKKVLKPGLHCSFRFFCNLIRYTKKPLQFELVLKSAMSKNGKAKNYKEDGKEVERAELNVVLTFITYFDPKKINKIVETAPGNDALSLGPVVGPYVLGVVRSVVSEMPWPLFNGERTKVANYILSKMIPSLDYYDLSIENEDDNTKPNVYSFNTGTKKSADEASLERSGLLIQFGFDLERTSLEIQNVDFTDPSLSIAFNSCEKSRLEGESVIIASEATAQSIRNKGAAEVSNVILQNNANITRIKEEGRALAEARRDMIKEIRDTPDLEYLHTLEQMAKGTSNTVLYQIPKSFEERVSKIMGGNKPEDFFSFLKDERIIEALKEAIEKITKK